MKFTEGNIRALDGGRGKPFPHLSRRDTEVWMRFLPTDWVKGAAAVYDVRLGGLGAAPVDRSHPHFAMWELLSKKRVDVILRWPGVVAIVEVKPHASFAALGQVLGYGYLWQKDNPKGGKPYLVVACETCDADLRPVFAHFGVQVWELDKKAA